MKSSDEFPSFMVVGMFFFILFAQDWSVRFRKETNSLCQVRSSRSGAPGRTAAAANPGPTRPRPSPAEHHPVVKFCSIYTVLCFDSLLTRCDEAGPEVGTWCSSATNKADIAERTSPTGLVPLLYPIQAKCNQRPAAVRSGTSGHPHLPCRPCRVRRSCSPTSHQHLESRFAVLFAASRLLLEKVGVVIVKFGCTLCGKFGADDGGSTFESPQR